MIVNNTLSTAHPTILTIGIHLINKYVLNKAIDTPEVINQKNN